MERRLPHPDSHETTPTTRFDYVFYYIFYHFLYLIISMSQCRPFDNYITKLQCLQWEAVMVGMD